ncbi:DUF3889 domain-containing protein [Falsibacillus albus]|nr:DUF3889 domain-containing protein [Falsibacillus albus]
MKHIVLSVGFCILMLLGSSLQASAQKVDYAKYGRMATAIVKEDYPSEELTEYQYMGRKKLGEDLVQDNFKFTVKENNMDKIIIVQVTHSPQNEKLVTLAVKEASQ